MTGDSSSITPSGRPVSEFGNTPNEIWVPSQPDTFFLTGEYDTSPSALFDTRYVRGDVVDDIVARAVAEERSLAAHLKPSKYKFCPQCERNLHVTKFSLNRARADGRMGYCRECHAEYMVGWRRTQDVTDSAGE